MHDETLDSLERTSAHHLPGAHGGELVDLYVGPERRAEIKRESREMPSWDLTHRDEINEWRSLADSDHA